MREAPGVPSAPNATLWNRRTGTGLPVRVLRSRSSTSVFTSPGAALSVVKQRGAFAGDDVVELERAGADLGEIVVEPVRQGGVEIDDVAGGIDGEEAGRRVVEIIDGVLELLEHVLLALALAAHVGDRPHGHAGVVLAGPERAHAHAQPAPALAGLTGDAHLLLQPAAFARRLEQAVDGFGDVRVADEHPLDRPHVGGLGRADQIEIGGIGVKHAAVLVGDHDAIEAVVDHRLEQRISLLAAAEAHDAGGERKQREDADGAEHGEQRQNVVLGMAAAEIHQPGGGGDQQHGDQQHQADRAAARGALALVERLPRFPLAAVLRRRPRGTILTCHNGVEPCFAAAHALPAPIIQLP